MAPEVAHSLLGLRGDDNTPMDIESIHGIMQQQAPPGISQQQTLAVSSDAVSAIQISSISESRSGGGGSRRGSIKRKRTADDEQVVGKATIQPSVQCSQFNSFQGTLQLLKEINCSITIHARFHVRCSK